jgi:hypothetical protein
MPFKSEKQRRYLWANEPEIARDWTDTYGSRIAAALGGIMALAQGGRTGFYVGGSHHAGSTTDTGGTTGNGSHDRGGKRHQAIAQQAIETAATRGGDDTRELAIEKYSTNPYGQKKKGFVGGVMDIYNKFGLIPNAWRLGKKIFGPSVEDENPYSTGRFTMGNPHLNKVTGPTTGPDRGGDRPYFPPQYIDDVYAQNIMEEDDIDIDTSTGNMEDWSQRFRVDDQYRQDKGALDPQIREYISKLYT